MHGVFFITAFFFFLSSSYNNLAIHLYFRIMSDIILPQGTGLCQKDKTVEYNKCVLSFVFIKPNVAVMFGFLL